MSDEWLIGYFRLSLVLTARMDLRHYFRPQYDSSICYRWNESFSFALLLPISIVGTTGSSCISSFLVQ